MAAVVPTIVEIHNLPTTKTYGSSAPKRLAQAFVRFGAATASDTIALGSYLPNLQTIEHQIAYTLNTTPSATLNTWSGATITLKDNNTSTAGTLLLMVSY